jgi:hypothetical protein
MKDMFKKYKSMIIFGVIVVVLLIVSNFTGG